jgi:hypothetical protein
MSRSRSTSGSNSPVKKYLSFKGSKGKVRYYDKNRAEDERDVELDSLDLIILDIKSSVSGFNEGSSSSISSNLLDPYATGREEFVVKSKVNGSYGVVAQGIWKDIKDEVSSIGGKFTTNLFALADLNDGEGYQIVKLELNGSALSPWIEFVGSFDNERDIYDNVITITKGQLQTRKKGKNVDVSDEEYKKVIAAIKKDPMTERPVWFYGSAFSATPITEEQVEMAIEQDNVLQAYFDSVGVTSDTVVEEEDSAAPSPTATSPTGPAGSDDDDDLPF